MCDVQTIPINTANRRIVDLIIGQYVTQCKHKVSYKYGKRQVENADHIIIATKSKNTRHNGKRTMVCGFLLYQRKQTHGYIDIVCSSNNMGGTLINSAENLTRQLGLPFIKLSALSHVITYYTRRGYRHVNNPCINNNRQSIRGNPTNGYRMTKCL